VRDTSKAQFVTRSHSNSKSHARARPKRESLPNEASVVMMRRVRVGFLYVTLRLNAAAFSKSVRFLFSLVLFFVLIYLYSLHLSSRPRTFLIGAPAQESISKVHFCASFALGRPRERKKSLVLIELGRKTHEIISRFLFFVSLFFPPFREFHRRNELGTNQRDLFNDWHLLPNEVHQFLSVFRYREQEEREERFERDAASSDTYHGHCFTYSAACFLLRFCGFLRNREVFVFCRENSNIFLRKRALCICVIMRENTRKNNQRITSSSGEGVVTRMRKMEVSQRDSLWDVVVKWDDICFKHILPRLNATDLKFFYEVNTETRKLIKRSSRAKDLKKKFYIGEMSSISTLEFAWEHYPWGGRGFLGKEMDEPYFCREVAKTNKLELLKWAREEKKCEWDEWTIDEAALQGNLEMVKYCVANECPIDEMACAEAAGNGDLEVLKYLREEAKAPWDSETAAGAAESGHLHILEYLVDRKYDEFDEWACVCAAMNGQLDCLKYLHEEAVREAHDNEHTECVQYLLDNNCPLPIEWRYDDGTLYDEFYQQVGLREQ
jgi:hypothetical protein